MVQRSLFVFLLKKLILFFLVCFCEGCLDKSWKNSVSGGCLKRSKTEKTEKKVEKFGVFLTKKRVRGVGSSHRGV